jgi:DNA-binding MarR family transcriptional regulator
VKGLAARLPKSGDKRMVTIALTSKGDRLMKKIPALLHEKLAEKLEKLDDSTIGVIKGSLELLVNLLDIDDLEAFPPVAFDTDDIPENNGTEDI